eukprot:357565-Chlamydomonas_euryale.AAC.4
MRSSRCGAGLVGGVECGGNACRVAERQQRRVEVWGRCEAGVGRFVEQGETTVTLVSCRAATSTCSSLVVWRSLQQLRFHGRG